MVTLCALLVLLRLASAHTDHSFDLDDANDAGMSYAERHVSASSLPDTQRPDRLEDAYRASHRLV